MKLNIQLFAASKSTSFSESNVNQSANTSSLTITIYFSANNTATYFSSATLKCTCNGSTQSATVSHSKGGSVTKSFTFNNIAHNDNGTKTVSWSWNCDTGTSVLGNISDSGTRALTTIPRQSKLEDIDDFAIATGTIIPITITKYVSEYTDNLVVSIGSTTIKTITGITTGYNLSFTSSEVATMQGLFSGSSTEVTFTLSTYNGDTLIGSSVVTASGIDASRIMGLSRYKSSTGYKYCINEVLDKTLDDGLQVGGKIYLNGKDIMGYNILYNGAPYWPSSSQPIQLSDLVSNQRLGIIICWQAWDGGARAWDLNYHFIPKFHVIEHNGNGIGLFLTTSSGETIGTKYLYVYDDRIEGRDNNSSARTNRSNSGIYTTSKYWALTAVIGI